MAKLGLERMDQPDRRASCQNEFHLSRPGEIRLNRPFRPWIYSWPSVEAQEFDSFDERPFEE